MNFLTILLQLQLQLRIYHWQTDKYSIHKALGNSYVELDKLIDQFVEEFMGKYGKIRSENEFSITLKNIDQLDTVDFVDSGILFLTNTLPSVIDSNDTNLLNIRDEMLSELEKLKYLLTLN